MRPESRPKIGRAEIEVVEPGTTIWNPQNGRKETVTESRVVRLGPTIYMTPAAWQRLRQTVQGAPN